MELKIKLIGLSGSEREVDIVVKITTEGLPILGTGSVTKITLPEKIKRMQLPHLYDSLIQTVTRVERIDENFISLITQDSSGRRWRLVAEHRDTVKAP